MSNWKLEANCRGHTDLFFADHGRTPWDHKVNQMKQRQALELCSDCPVTDLCLNAALEHADTVGIWAGRRFPLARRNAKRPPLRRDEGRDRRKPTDVGANR